MLNYLSKLALRIRDDKVSHRARFLKYAFGISYLWIVLQNPFHVLLGLILVPAIGISLISGVLALVVFVFGIMYLALLFQLGVQLKEAEHSAVQT
jgi:hypothetical protein